MYQIIPQVCLHKNVCWLKVPVGRIERTDKSTKLAKARIKIPLNVTENTLYKEMSGCYRDMIFYFFLLKPSIMVLGKEDLDFYAS